VRIALDTNVLAYAEGVNVDDRHGAALELIERLPQESVVLPVQALGELFNVLTRKAGRTRTSASDALLAWQDAFVVADTSSEVMLTAASLAADHRLGIWDAVILATASAAGCRLVLSEDFQNGFTWAGVTVTNPFAPARHPLLEAMLSEDAASR
jgi:predicted nucleic acid-binding protein